MPKWKEVLKKKKEKKNYIDETMSTGANLRVPNGSSGTIIENKVVLDQL